MVADYFLQNPDLYPGMKIDTNISGNDTFRIIMPDGTTTKVFQADPKFGGTRERAQEVWDWINSNYKK